MSDEVLERKTPTPLIPIFDERTARRMQLIVKDANNIWLVFVVPLLIPIFGVLSTGWLAIRLWQWQRIDTKWTSAMSEARGRSNVPISDYTLWNSFQDARRKLWIGCLIWPCIIAVVVLVVTVIYAVTWANQQITGGRSA